MTPLSPQGERGRRTTKAGRCPAQGREGEQGTGPETQESPQGHSDWKPCGFLCYWGPPCCSTFSGKGKQSDRPLNDGLTTFNSPPLSQGHNRVLSPCQGQSWRSGGTSWQVRKVPGQGPGVGGACPYLCDLGQVTPLWISPAQATVKSQRGTVCKMLVTNSNLLWQRYNTLVLAELPLQGRPALSHLRQLNSPRQNRAISPIIIKLNKKSSKRVTACICNLKFFFKV